MRKHVLRQLSLPPNKDPRMPVRLLLAFLLVASLVYLSYWLFQNQLAHLLGDMNQASQVSDALFSDKIRMITRLSLILSILNAAILFGFLAFLEWLRTKQRKTVLHMAFVDELTGIANKNGFRLDAEKMIQSGREIYALILVDLDNFKLVNDLFGFAQGDLLLRHVAATLERHTAPNESFGRVSGDKFCLLMAYRNADEFEQRLFGALDRISQYSFPSDTHFNLSACAGIYVVRDRSVPIDTAMDRAALALDKAHPAHHGGVFYYNEEIRSQLIAESELVHDMGRALADGEFKLHLQPQIDLVTGRITRAEVLVRWQHPQKGLIMPQQFIPVIERNGLVSTLDFQVFREVCRLQRIWQDGGRAPLILAVNQSRLHLHNLDYVDNLLQITREFKVDPGGIELELTESSFAYDLEILATVAASLRRNGFRLSIDNFGSGSSALNLLKAVQVDVIKFDREFFFAAANDLRGRTIVETIIQMTRDLGIETVAEGVETAEQAQYLKSIGCSRAQGFFFQRPMPVPEFTEFTESIDSNNPGW
jgi:diguanylate cyclase (GGDEF)-like protein